MTYHEAVLHKTSEAIRESWDIIDRMRAGAADIATIVASSRVTIAETQAMIRLIDRMNGN